MEYDSKDVLKKSLEYANRVVTFEGLYDENDSMTSWGVYSYVVLVQQSPHIDILCEWNNVSKCILKGYIEKIYYEVLPKRRYND